MHKVIITGIAGFIGNRLALKLLECGIEVVGIDNMSNNSELLVHLKNIRIECLMGFRNFTFIHADINNINKNDLMQYSDADAFVHLAANAGIKESKIYACEYFNNNVIGFYNVIEIVRILGIPHFIYASSSSIYGNSRDINHNKNNQSISPKNIYAITKVVDELIAKLYSDNYKLKTTGLRFFSVYGPYGRPDMAPWIFADSILHKKKFYLANGGNVYRDFTYIDDIVHAIYIIIENTRTSTFKVYDIGASSPISLIDFVKNIESVFHKKAIFSEAPLLPEESQYTIANMSDFYRDYKYFEFTPINKGIQLFCNWYKHTFSEEK